MTGRNSVEHGVCSLVTSMLTKEVNRAETYWEREKTPRRKTFSANPRRQRYTAVLWETLPIFPGHHYQVCARIERVPVRVGEHFRCTQPVCRPVKRASEQHCLASALCAALVHKLWFTPTTPPVWCETITDRILQRDDGQTEPLRGAVGFVCVCWLWQRSRSCHSRRHL